LRGSSASRRGAAARKTPRRARITALAGGVGAARLLRGLVRVVAPEDLTVVVNTGDDEDFYGLHVSPDLDTIVYNLAGVAPLERGWGLDGDTGRALEALRRFYGDAYFSLGDADLATNLFRTDALRRGRRLHEVTAEVASAFGVRSRVLPMTNDRVRTLVRTGSGELLPFQVYFVKRRARDAVAEVIVRGLDEARPAPGVLAAIRAADLLVLPPSNPFTSLLPIVGVPGVSRALHSTRAPVVAVSPVAGGRAVRGPLGGMLRAAGHPVSPLGIAEVYSGLVDGLVIDEADRRLAPALERSGVAVAVTDIRMDSIARSTDVARVALALAARLPRREDPTVARRFAAVRR
jgi:LPPG:FO 2-phospho-L-lactate transferase